MKSKLIPSVFFVFVLMLFFAESSQAQTKKAPIQKMPLIESNFESQAPSSKSLIHALPFQSNTIENLALPNPKLKDGSGAAKMVPLVDDYEPIVVPREVISPTVADIKRANKKVAGLVSVLKAESTTSFNMVEHDNVLLHYNANSGKIELSSLNNKNAVLQEVSASSLSGVLVIKGNNNDNNLVIDETILDLGIQILYDGGAQNAMRGDELTLTNNGAPIDKLVVNHWNKSSGQLIIDAKTSITYTGLEPITNTGTVNDIIINLPNTPNPDAVLANFGPGLFNLSGSTFESTTFAIPLNSLTINGGTDVDALSVQGIDPVFDADFSVNLDTDDALTFETTATALGSGNLSVATGFLTIRTDITTAGNIEFTSERSTVINNNATVAITDGTMTIAGATTPLVGDIYSGVLIDNGNLLATGTGSISVTGTGANDGSGDFAMGVTMIGASSIQTATGDIDIIGAGASSGGQRLYGIGMEGSPIIQTTDGNITMQGTGGTGTGSHQLGVYFRTGSQVHISGSGTLTVTGTGGNGAGGSNTGIGMYDASITTSGGGAILTGNGGSGGNLAQGVVIFRGSNISDSVDGDIIINGTAGTGTGDNRGVDFVDILLTDPPPAITTNNGDIIITGTGGVNGNFNRGISLLTGDISATGTGSVVLNGTTNSTGTLNEGVYVENSNVSTKTGDITMTGMGNGAGVGSDGVDILGTSLVSTSSGNINLIGTTLATGYQHKGVYIYDPAVVLTQDGIISMNGTGGDGPSGEHTGVVLGGGNVVQVTGLGTANITGTGGSGGSTNAGILLYNSGLVSTSGGGVTFNGQGGTGTGNGQLGIYIIAGGSISDSAGGDIILNGTGGAGARANIGVYIFSALGTSITSTDGDIVITGAGGTGGDTNNGVRVEAGPQITATGTGSVQIEGTAGDGTSSNVGIFLSSPSFVQTVDGNISMNGTGSTGTGEFQIGTALLNGNVVQIAGAGTANITGTGGSGTNNNYGLLVQNSSITTAGGGAVFTGNGGIGTGGGQIGIAMLLGSTISDAGIGNLILNGTAGNGVDLNSGIQLDNASVVSALNGNITMTGVGTGTGNENYGIRMLAGAVVENTGTGAANLQGIGGAGFSINQGIRMEDSGTRITTNDGGISLIGTGGNATGLNNEGITIINEAIIEAYGTGSINMTGVATAGVDANKGVVLYAPNTYVRSNGGGITITGTGAGTGSNNAGVSLENGSVVQDLTNGNVVLNGTGGNGLNVNRGINVIGGSVVSSPNGDISLTGNGGVGTGNSNDGVFISGLGSQLTSSQGSIQIIANGGSSGGGSQHIGLYVNDSGVVQTLDGNITVNGVGGDGVGNYHAGVIIASQGRLESTGAGIVDITGTGGAGASSNHGVSVQNSNSLIAANGGGIVINGTGGPSTGSYSLGVIAWADGDIIENGAGSISINGTGGMANSASAGVWIQSAGTTVVSNGGGISLDGTAGPTAGDFSIGVFNGFEADIIENGTGAITIIGNADTANIASYGFLMQTVGSSIVSNGGGITITGTADTVISSDVTGAVFFEALLQDTGNGTIAVNGNGGTGPEYGNGIWMDLNTVITASTGDVEITGTATNTSGTENQGVYIVNNSQITSTSGNVELTGTSANTSFVAVDIVSIGGPIAAGGAITVTGITGEINTPEGIPATAIFDGTNTIINGILAPGQSPGQITINGNLTAGAGDSLEFEFLDYLVPGTDFDQIVVVGGVDITDATLALENISGFPEDSCETVVLINNDGADAVIGTFAGIAEGGSVASGGITGKVSYVGGDGNDVVLLLDSTPPVLSCPADITQGNDPGVCGAVISYTPPVGTDNCAGAATIQIAGLPSGSTFPVGTTTNTFETTDASGNITTCSFTVTVNDTEAPVISCPANITQNSDPGVCGAFVTVPPPVFSDNCGTICLKSDNIDSYLLGPLDGQSPDWETWSGNPSESAEVSNEQPLSGPNSLKFDGSTGIIDQIYKLGNQTSGVWEVTFNMYIPAGSGAGHNIQKFETPAIEWASQVNYSSGPSALYSVNGTITSFSFPHDAWFQVKYIIDQDSDLSEFYIDGTLIISHPYTHTVNGNGGANSLGAINLYPNSSNSLFYLDDVSLCGNAAINDYNNTTDASDNYPVGVTNVVWTVMDAAGNTASCTQVITVVDNEAPVITCPADITQDNDPGVCNADVIVPLPTFTDNCYPTGCMQNDDIEAYTLGPIFGQPGATDWPTWSGIPGESAEVSTEQALSGTQSMKMTGIPTGGPVDQLYNLGGSTSGVWQVTYHMYVPVGNTAFTNTQRFENAAPSEWAFLMGFNSDGTGDYLINNTLTSFTYPQGVWFEVRQYIDQNLDYTELFVNGVSVISHPFTYNYNGTSGTNSLGALNFYPVTNTLGTDPNPSAIPLYYVDDLSVCALPTNDYNGGGDASDNYPVGTTNVIWTVTDAAGNSDSCTQTITIEDNEAPVITCAPNGTRDTDPGVCSYTVVGTEFDAVFTDNCTLGVITNDLNGTNTIAGAVLPKGVTTVIWIVDDNNGQTATCTTVITVEDNEAPVITCAPNGTRDTDPGLCQYTVVGIEFDAFFTDNCPDGSISNDLNGTDTIAGEILVPGVYTVVWTANDGNGQIVTCTNVITIEDNEPPVIACPADISVSTNPGDCYSEVTFPDAVALDNCGVASVIQTAGLPSGSQFPVGVSTVEFTATDVNGNPSVCSFTITITDNEAPMAVCQDITIQLDANGDAMIVVADVDGGSTDNCGVASISIDVDTFDCSDVGPNPVVLTVTDVNGNVSSCTAIVTVEDVTPPVAVCMDITVQLDPSGTVTILGSDIGGASTDACGIATYELDIDTFTCADVGDNPVVLTVTDVNGNMSTCTAIVTVEDNTAPDLVCMDITLELGADGTATIVPADVIATNDDACGILTTAVDIFMFDCSDIGTPVTVQVFSQDVNGNLSTCTAVVTVVDLLAPELTCPPDQTVDPGPGNLFYEVPDYFANGQAIAIDNCTDPVVITTQDPAAGTLLSDGTYTVTCTATDEYGNTAICDFELIVESVLGIVDNVDILSIVLYPNPATDYVMISNPNSVALQSVAIYDINGRLIKTVNLMDMGTEKAIDISELASATYMFIIQGTNGQLTKQLIKE